MTATSRELVYQTLQFERPARVPRQLWSLPWAGLHYPDALAAIRRDYPDDIQGIGGHLSETPIGHGDPYVAGSYVDDWGATFVNIQAGVHGEIKDPLVRDWNTDLGGVHVPREWLSIDRDAVNRDCQATDLFAMAGACPRPFEQLQFLRGSEGLMMDLCDPPPAMQEFMRTMHAFYCELLEAWACTDVDSLIFMDDWGSQRGLLIRPAVWRAIFKPMYRDYVQIAHGAGKKIFMHSDGHTLAIYPDLVELGVDAVNTQIFCMGIENLRPFAGRITFWGEIDRQHLLPNGTPDAIDRAVHSVHKALWVDGGCIAQCEFSAGGRPENVRQVFASWDDCVGSSC